MLIGALSNKTDRRAPIVPSTIAKLLKAEHQVCFEADLGAKAFFSDEAYQASGASLKPRAEILTGTDLILCLEPPSDAEIATIPAGTYLIGMFNPLVDTALAERLKSQGVKAFSLDRIPRTTIAQSMDVLSSMASLAGYRAVLAGANALPSYFPMLMTAAGTIPPAKVLILGAGVAGLQAIATARRLGAQVEAFDVRAAAKEEVLSLGAKFVEVEGSTDDSSAGGYAVEQTEAYKTRQKELIHTHAAKADVIITTANIPGRKAPLLVEERTVMAMKPGSVIVDLAAVTGGNCALTQDGKTVVVNGVSIIGNSHLAAEMSSDASRLYSNNVYNFFSHVFREAAPNLEDEITAGTLIQ